MRQWFSVAFKVRSLWEADCATEAKISTLFITSRKHSILHLSYCSSMVSFFRSLLPAESLNLILFCVKKKSPKQSQDNLDDIIRVNVKKLCLERKQSKVLLRVTRANRLCSLLWLDVCLCVFLRLQWLIDYLLACWLLKLITNYFDNQFRFLNGNIFLVSALL